MNLLKCFAVCLSVLALSVQAAPLDTKKTTLTATFKQLGVEVTAKFNSVNGAIDFDPAHPAQGKAQITVPLTGFDLGDAEYNKEVQKKEWFNSAQFPQATFASNQIVDNGNGKLLVKGKLTLKGKTLDVAIPITFRTEAGAAVFDGQLVIKRLFFDIGEGEWKDTGILADDVVIKFKAVTLK